jgi:hypothetical protein
LVGEEDEMIFSVDGETARWIQKTLSRLRCKRDWPSLATRDAYWTPAFLGALIDEVDYLLTAGFGKEAHQISRHLQVLAERIRPEVCPQQELGQRSLVVWAVAVHGSSCRYISHFSEAESTFALAFQKAEGGVLPWARADLDRRFAILLTQRGDRRAFDLIESALAGFGDLPEKRAETLILRGVARSEMDNDSSGAISDYSNAAALVDPRKTERARWNYNVALHNLSYQLIIGDCISFDSVTRARQMLLLTRSYFGQGMCARKLTSFWVEGLLAFRFGWNRHSGRLLEKARRGFLKLGCYDCAMVVSLDLALVLLEDGEPEEAAECLRSAGEALPEGLKHASEYSGFWKTTLDRQALLQTRSKLAGLLPRNHWLKARIPHPKASPKE